MNTGAALRARGRPGERVGVWHADYKPNVKEVASTSGGGSPGMGLSKDAAKQVYAELNNA